MPLSAAFSIATQALGGRYDPYMAFNFVIEIEGLLVGGFTEVTGLESEVAVQEYQEGGLNGFTHKLPGPAKSPNLILSHGLTDIDTLWNWHEHVAKGIIKRKNGTIMLLDRQRFPSMWWDFWNAYPVKWSGPALNANSDTTVAIERVELAHEGLTKSVASKLLSGTRGALQLSGVHGP